MLYLFLRVVCTILLIGGTLRIFDLSAYLLSTPNTELLVLGFVALATWFFAAGWIMTKLWPLPLKRKD